MILTGAGQIGMAIACRVGFGKKVVIGDKSLENAEKIGVYTAATSFFAPFPSYLRKEGGLSGWDNGKLQ